jgi:hypothetical protein
MSTSPHKLIFVLGMHRSGTSAVARGLRTLGVQLGPNLMGAGVDNPRGYWEDLDIVALNEEMLQSLDMRLESLAPLTQADVANLLQNGFQERALSLLQSKVERYKFFAFKDPRTAKLWPFWRQLVPLLQADVSCIIVLRHPNNVAESLRKRNGIDVFYGHLMWITHMVPIAVETPGCKKFVVEYDRLLTNPRGELERMSRFLSMKINPSEAESYEMNFLDFRLRHNCVGDRMSCDMHPLVSELYDLLHTCSSAEKSFDIPPSSAAAFMREYERSGFLLKKIEALVTLRNQQQKLLNAAKFELNWKNTSFSWKLTSPLRRAAEMVQVIRAGRKV